VKAATIIVVYVCLPILSCSTLVLVVLQHTKAQPGILAGLVGQARACGVTTVEQEGQQLATTPH